LSGVVENILLTFVREDVVVGLCAGILQDGFFQAIFWAAARGFGDSLKGTVAIFYLVCVLVFYKTGFSRQFFGPLLVVLEIA